MSPKSPRCLLAAARRLVHTDPASVAATEVMPVIDERTCSKVLDLSTRIGESMFAIGASAHEVTLAITRVADAYGLAACRSTSRTTRSPCRSTSGEVWPETLVRVVRVAAPDHAKLQRRAGSAWPTSARASISESARTAFRAIRRVPFRYRQPVVVVARALLAVGVSILLGASPVVVGLTFVAALARRSRRPGSLGLRVPLFFSQIAGGFVTTVVAVAVSALGAAGIEPFVGIRPSIIVASGIVLMLAGLTVVGAAQDAIDGFALTAGGRILDLTMQTLGVVIGILVGPGARQRARVHDGPAGRPRPVRPAARPVRRSDHHRGRRGGLQRRRHPDHPRERAAQRRHDRRLHGRQSAVHCIRRRRAPSARCSPASSGC